MHPTYCRQQFPGNPISVRIQTILEPVIDQIALVVACPQRDGRMLAQLPDNRLRLMPHHPMKFRSIRIKSAPHHKIMPNQNSLPVTAVIELLAFIDSAAPDPNHIAIELCRIVQNQVVTFGIAGMQSIRRDMVRSKNSDRKSIHNKLEIRFRRIGGTLRPFQFNASDPERQMLFRQRFPGRCQQDYRNSIKVRLSIIARPPQLRRRNFPGKISLIRPERKCFFPMISTADSRNFHQQFSRIRQCRSYRLQVQT